MQSSQASNKKLEGLLKKKYKKTSDLAPPTVEEMNSKRELNKRPPGHYFRINVKSTIYLFVLNIVRMFLNFVSKMVDWILNTHFAVEKVDVANGREHPHY